MSRRLVGDAAGLWRYRVHPYRVIYSIDEANRVVRILRIEHRSKVYE